MSVQIPNQCGAILLPETVLFPQGALPLHIFEARYREMLEDILEGNCMMCVGTLNSEETEDPSECTERVGTIGLVRASKEIEDGRSNLILHGIARVEFGGWSGDRSYPFARIAPMPSWPTSGEEAELEVLSLRHALDGVLRGFPEALREQLGEILDEASSPAMLGDIVAHQFVLEQEMRRALLDEVSVGKRLKMLTNYLRMVGSENG